MSRERLDRRVRAAVARASRKFFPNVRVCRKDGAEIRVDACLLPQADVDVRGADVGVRAALVCSSAVWGRVVSFCGSVENVGSVRVGEVEWSPDVQAVNCVEDGAAGIVYFHLFRVCACR